MSDGERAASGIEQDVQHRDRHREAVDDRGALERAEDALGPGLDAAQPGLGDARVADRADQAGLEPEVDVVEHADDVDVEQVRVRREGASLGEVQALAGDQRRIDDRDDVVVGELPDLGRRELRLDRHPQAADRS